MTPEPEPTGEEIKGKNSGQTIPGSIAMTLTIGSREKREPDDSTRDDIPLPSIVYVEGVTYENREKTK